MLPVTREQQRMTGSIEHYLDDVRIEYFSKRADRMGSRRHWHFRRDQRSAGVDQRRVDQRFVPLHIDDHRIVSQTQPGG